MHRSRTHPQTVPMRLPNSISGPVRAGQADAQRMQQPDFWSDGNCHPLAGLAVSTKDLFDVAGQATRASSPVLSDAPAALQDAPAVARLRDAGAALLGRSHMVEFVFRA